MLKASCKLDSIQFICAPLRWKSLLRNSIWIARFAKSSNSLFTRLDKTYHIQILFVVLTVYNSRQCSIFQQAWFDLNRKLQENAASVFTATSRLAVAVHMRSYESS